MENELEEKLGSVIIRHTKTQLCKDWYGEVYENDYDVETEVEYTLQDYAEYLFHYTPLKDLDEARKVAIRIRPALCDDLHEFDKDFIEYLEEKYINHYY